jgi:iron complex outermembrane receptor protein
LDNHFYGGTFSVAYKKSKFDVTLGGAANQYIGDHFGELIWMQFAGDIAKDFNYYRGESTKNDGNLYARSNYRFAEKFNLYVDVQGRVVQYITKGIDNDLRAYDVNDELFFFNPKAGITFNRTKKEQAYFSVAVGNKEPNRNDYVDAPSGVTPRPESMIDFEGGYALSGEKINARINFYYMQYKDQLVLTGELNDVGAPLRMNVDNSFRRGIELEIAYRPVEKLLFSGNATFSQNKIESFEELLYDYTNGFDIVRIQHSNTDIAFSPSVIAGGRAEYFVHKNISVSWLPRYVGRQYLNNTQNEFLSIDPYFVNDIAVRWSKITKRENKVAIQVLTNNAFNEMYSSNGYTFSYIFDQRITERFFYPQAGRFFLLSFQLEF